MSAAELSFGKTRKFLGPEGASCGVLNAATLVGLAPRLCEGVGTAIPNAEQPSSSASRRFGNFIDLGTRATQRREERTLTLPPATIQ